MDKSAEIRARCEAATPGQTHELKCWPEYFDALVTGNKTFEFRRNDRGYKVGDILDLREWDPIDNYGYTGRAIELRVTYVLDLNEFVANGKPVLPGYVIMGLESLENRNLRADLTAMTARAEAAERMVYELIGRNKECTFCRNARCVYRNGTQSCKPIWIGLPGPWHGPVAEGARKEIDHV